MSAPSGLRIKILLVEVSGFRLRIVMCDTLEPKLGPKTDSAQGSVLEQQRAADIVGIAYTRLRRHIGDG